VTGTSPELAVCASADELAQDAAGRLAATLVSALAVRPFAHVAVTGGSILERTFAALAALPTRDEVEWHRVHVWWGDERFVPADSDDRNDEAAFAAGLGELPLDPALVHRMPSTDSGYGDDVDAAARQYAETLATADPANSTGGVPNFDIVMLGIGPDGHCASLFPGHPGTRVLDRPVIGLTDSPKPPPARLSLTFPALDTAREICFVASGPSKADAVAAALSGADPTDVPSAGPKGRDRTLWLIDEDAAAKLPADLRDAAATR
jgi:6-phosphogluconolactonase